MVVGMAAADTEAMAAGDMEDTEDGATAAGEIIFMAVITMAAIMVVAAIMVAAGEAGMEAAVGLILIPILTITLPLPITIILMTAPIITIIHMIQTITTITPFPTMVMGLELDSA